MISCLLIGWKLWFITVPIKLDHGIDSWKWLITIWLQSWQQYCWKLCKKIHCLFSFFPDQYHCLWYIIWLLQVMIIGIYCRTYLLRHNPCTTSHYSIYNAYLDEKVKVLAIMNFLVLQNLTNIECSPRLESSYPLFPS